MNKFLLSLILLLGSQVCFAQATECDEGWVFNTSLNRCVLSESTVETKTQALNCEGLEGEEFKQCFSDNVNNDVAELEADGDIKKASKPKKNLFIPGIITLGGAYIIFTQKDSLKECGSTSVYLMTGAGLATLLGEMNTQRKYKKKLKKLAKEYKEKVKEKSAKDDENLAIINENQVAAFNFQIEQEKARESAHKSRKKTYNLAFGLYSAAAVMAIVEQFQLGADNTCNLSGEKKGDSTADNSGGDSGGGADGGDTNPGKEASLLGGMGDMISNGLKTPWVRAALAGLLAMNSKKVADKAGKLAKEAGERVEAIEQLRDDFIANNGAGFDLCSDEDRRKPSKPECYCYTSEGKKDMSKEGSPTCLAFWTNNPDYGDPTDYDGNIVAQRDPQGCIDDKMKPCDCGSGKCTTLSGSLNLGPLANVQGVPQMLTDTKKLADGKMSTAEIDEAQIGRVAAKLNKQREKMTKNPKLKGTLNKINDLQLKMDKTLGKRIRKAAAQGKVSPALAGFGGSSSKGVVNPNQILEKTKKDLAKIKKGDTPLFAARRSKKGSMDDYDFGGSKGGVNISDEEYTEVMEKNFKINDINQNDYGNLFTIIHNRYQTSGMKRLFEESKEDNAK